MGSFYADTIGLYPGIWTIVAVFKIENSQASNFLAACEEGSIRAASERLGTEPSTVSRQIQALEQSLNTTLIERGRRGVSPTQAGDILLAYLKRQQNEQEALLFEFDELAGMRRGELVVAVGNGFVSDFIGNALTKYKQSFPGFTYDLITGSTEQVMHAVRTDRAHIGLAYNASKDRMIRVAAQTKQPLEVLVSPTSEWAGMTAPLSMRDLEGVPCALLKSGSGVVDMIRAAEASHGARLTATVRSDSLMVLRNFVREGLGVTILPAFVVTREIAEGTVATKPLDVSEFHQGEASILTRSGRRLPEGATRLVDYAIRSMAAFSPVN